MAKNYVPVLTALFENHFCKNFNFIFFNNFKKIKNTEVPKLIICPYKDLETCIRLADTYKKDTLFFIFYDETLTNIDLIPVAEREWRSILLNPDQKDHKAYIENTAHLLCMLVLNVQQIIHYKERINRYIIDSFSNVVNEYKLTEANQEIKTLYSELEKISRIDPLTKTLNRRALLETANNELRRAFRNKLNLTFFTHQDKDDFLQIKLREKYHFKGSVGKIDEHFGVFSCAIIDLDNFKAVNDTYGHLIGDVVLKKIGEVFVDSGIFRQSDIIGRYGGDEFLIIFPDTSIKNSLIPLRRFTEEVNQIKFRYDSKNEHDFFHVSLSIGASEFALDDNSIEDILMRADKALYYAKNHGRNSIVVYEDIRENFTGNMTDTEKCGDSKKFKSKKPSSRAKKEK